MADASVRVEVIGLPAVIGALIAATDLLAAIDDAPECQTPEILLASEGLRGALAELE